MATDSNKVQTKGNLLCLKILVPVLIVAVIAVIFIIKNLPEEEQKPDVPDELFGLNATTEIDFAALSEYGLRIIVDYGATSCIPCKQWLPFFKR